MAATLTILNKWVKVFYSFSIFELSTAETFYMKILFMIEHSLNFFPLFGKGTPRGSRRWILLKFDVTDSFIIDVGADSPRFYHKNENMFLYYIVIYLSNFL